MEGTPSILVAEDQDSARESLVELLRAESFDVSEAPDGKQAISLVDQLDLDLVLTDLMMPGADGLAVMKHIKEVSPQTLVETGPIVWAHILKVTNRHGSRHPGRWSAVG